MTDEFDDLIEAKDEAVEADDEAKELLRDAEISLGSAKAHQEDTAANLLAAHQAIQAILAERGEHYSIDQANGTVTVYKPIDEPPGWCAVHPIPGRTKKTK